MAIRTCAARAVVLYMKMGLSVDAAVEEAVEDMRRLTTGLVSRITIHAIDAAANHKVVAVNGNSSNTYWLWRNGDAEPRCYPADIRVITSADSKPTASLRYAAQRL
jgi:L-asparaginase